MVMRYVILFLLLLFSTSIYSNQYELSLLSYFNSKYLGKTISCTDKKYSNYTHKQRVKELFYDDEQYYVILRNNVICRFNFYIYGLNRTDLGRENKPNADGQQAIMDMQKFLNSMLQNIGEGQASLPKQSGFYDINQTQSQQNVKNNWTSKTEIHYTNLNSRKKDKSKVRVTTEGIFIDYYKVGVAFEREVNKEKK